MTDLHHVTEPTDEYTFRRGDLAHCIEGFEDPPRPSLMRRAWQSITWWRQVRYTVDDAQVAAGLLGVVRLRWSWRRWRWERA